MVALTLVCVHTTSIVHVDDEDVMSRVVTLFTLTWFSQLNMSIYDFPRINSVLLNDTPVHWPSFGPSNPEFLHLRDGDVIEIIYE